MSKGWEGGSTRHWREVVRPFVLARDNWVCRLCGQAIDPRLRHPHPRSAHVHHLDGVTRGHDPARLVASHRECNLAVGDPTKAADPQPKPMTQW